MTWAFGKAILFGEHAVVYGHPALAGAIDCRLCCALIAREPAGAGRLGLRVPAWDVAISSEDDHVVARALRAIVAALGAEVTADIEVDTALPPAAGLGSSAALSVAVTRALAEHVGRALTDDELERVASAGEACFHENPSGVDVALAARGGLGIFTRDRGITAVDARPFSLAVGLSGEPRSTAAMVAAVAARRRADRAGTDRQLGALGALAMAGRDAVERGDMARVGALMGRAHEVLCGLGVSTGALDELVASAGAAGALGAKLTGAGGGGAVIAVAPGGEADVVAAWRERGFAGFVCRVGVTR